MIADKKNHSTKLPQQANDTRIKSQDEFDTKRKIIRERMKANRVNYIVKDLPIY